MGYNIKRIKYSSSRVKHLCRLKINAIIKRFNNLKGLRKRLKDNQLGF